MTTNTPDPTPAHLSAARLAEIRDDADTCREALDEGALDFKHCEQEVYDAAYRLIAEGTRALLAHLDALTPRAPVDGEALGRGLYLRHHAGNAESIWPQLAYQEQRRWITAALAIHAIGHAAGRSEGEAERAEAARLALFVNTALADECAALRAIAADPKAHAAEAVAQEKALHDLEVEGLDATIARLTAALRTETTMKEQIQDQLVEMRGKHREEWERAERLTAEIAEARATVEAFRALPGYPHAEGVTPAMVKLRLEANGAREEREACALIAEDEERLLYRQDGEQACARVRRRIRARTTEGRQGS